MSEENTRSSGEAQMLEQKTKTVEELVRWVIAVDRRLLSMKAFAQQHALRPAEVAEKTGRSVQNINRAFHELANEGLVESVAPGKHSWNRYLLTEKGKEVLKALLGELEEKPI